MFSRKIQNFGTCRFFLVFFCLFDRSVWIIFTKVVEGTFSKKRAQEFGPLLLDMSSNRHVLLGETFSVTWAHKFDTFPSPYIREIQSNTENNISIRQGKLIGYFVFMLSPLGIQHNKNRNSLESYFCFRNDAETDSFVRDQREPLMNLPALALAVPKNQQNPLIV